MIPRAEHTISRKSISANALKVLYRLDQHGYSAYLVGGCLRDILLQIKPKDFDIATDARPEKIKKLFRNCLLIGRRFRLAHIRFGREVIEVTTFRADAEKKSLKHRTVAAHGMLLRDNIYGSIEEDAWRRDFTMNALYYNIADFSLIDYCGGLSDIQHKIVRIIGDPQTRYHEDPVRLLRAIRFAGKLGFTLDPATAEPIPELANLLHHVPPARLFEEVLKLFHHGQAFATYQLLRHYQLFNELFPQTFACLDKPATEKLLEIACKNTDQRLQEGKTVSPAFLFAIFLWPAVQAKVQHYNKKQTPLFILYQHAISHVLAEQQKQITIPRRYSTTIREIWDLQQRLIQRRPYMINRLTAHPRFRAAYDFLLLRAQIQEIPSEIASWWTDFIAADESTKTQLIEQIITQHKKPKRHKNRGKFV
ncbi:polynucleotide adenylyltransferase PcnB [Candidatus Rickettsiella viridis]|uniref:polynucleotide adenylyltransferase PcnB n=1 Tax=Candidatus Rickettsiella viridis TaxID=676208 RepID=UPI000F83AB43